ncbi:hypothetical protein H6G06_17140 [Anabaena sphaerica FACHB-251]|uniref:Cyanovirin-N domain-containing protein n=1 Tax=Anabaena sphaerica FACHB-251 TaxID=2692883 RepID=A0A926WIK3_9NOST|nr:CVNH domain-containing protein [Anabaena sphaerica]MBD2295158.1 hypothetical protein [Anabaena sphaerica FACHB-251]
MRLTIKFGWILLATTLPISAFIKSAEASSTYFNSCTNEAVRKGGNTGAALFADCQTTTGSTTRAEIDLDGINNINGRLEFSNAQDAYRSTFLESCSQARVVRGVLYAICKDEAGNDRISRLTLESIDNDSGLLRYRDSRYCCVPQTSAGTTDVPDINVDEFGNNLIPRLPGAIRFLTTDQREQLRILQELE